jgi:hypothetical protein
MKNFRLFFILLLFATAGTPFISKAQSVLDPADSVRTYDSTNRPAEPAWGQIGKWVRTPRQNWNTDEYKAYIYKGLAFRLKFPKSYNPTANDGKKYPMLIFWHGLMEAGTIYDNEFHLLLGCEMFKNAVDSGTFDGYVIAMQAQATLSGFFGSVNYQGMKEIIDYMVVNNKLDPFRVMNNGLSSGGIASIDMFLQNPGYISGLVTMSPPGNYTSTETINTMKFTPVWYANGGVDNNPPTTTADYNYSVMDSAGARFRKYTYPNNDHNTWDATWADRDFWPFMNRAYASNPWVLYGQTKFATGTPVNATIGLAPGFDEYQWRKDGVVITSATSRSIQATALGTYDARVRRGTTWSEWSRIPVQLVAASLPIKIEAEDYSSMTGIQTEFTADAGGGFNVAWQDDNDLMDYQVYIPTAGTYTVNFRVATMFNGPEFQLRNAAGSALATLTVPNTGNFQGWQTISAQVTLPAGQQRLRIYTTRANGGWNINWWEIQTGTVTPPSNKPPVVNAGSAQTITLPANSVQLSGTASDPDGTIASYNWSLVSGPSGSSFSAPSSAQTTVNGLVQGSYVFRLTATDNLGASGSGDVTVTVNAAPTGTTTRIEAENYSAMFGIQTEPTSDVGGGLNVGWQDNNDWMDYAVNISSAGTYTLNFRVASMFTGAQFQLRNASGTVLATLTVPNTGNFQAWQTISTSVSLPAGQQTLRIVTTQANGGWNINWWEIQGGTAPAPTNQAPAVNAGTAQTITLPTSSVQLSGTASDADGTIASYSWTQVSGPATASFSNAATAATTASGLTSAGSYTFQLTATDNAGASAYADLVITVNDAPPPPPTTNIHIEAETYTAMSGIQTETTTDAGSGLNVKGQDLNDWMDYSVNVPVAGVYTLNFRVANNSGGSQFELRSNGTALTRLSVPNTGGLQTWQTISIQVSLSAGQQTFRIATVKSKNPWNINWWEIVSTGTITTQRFMETETQTVQSGASLMAFPNPLTDQFTLSVNNAWQGRMKVEIINQMGVIQKQFTLDKHNAGAQNFSMAASGLPRGKYIVRVSMNNNAQALSIIKQ